MLKALEEKLFRTGFQVECSADCLYLDFDIYFDHSLNNVLVVEPTLLHKRIPKCVFSDGFTDKSREG